MSGFYQGYTDVSRQAGALAGTYTCLNPVCMLPVLQHACAGKFEHCNSKGYVVSLLKNDNHNNILSMHVNSPVSVYIARQRAAAQRWRCCYAKHVRRMLRV